MLASYLLLSAPQLGECHGLSPKLRAAERTLIVLQAHEVHLAKVYIDFVLVTERWHAVKVEALLDNVLQVARVDIEVLWRGSGSREREREMPYLLY